MIACHKSPRWLFAAAALLAMLFSASVMAQNSRTVQGIVLDAQKKPIPGASVQAKDLSITTNTGDDGRFKLTVPGGRIILIVSHVGKASQEINIGKQESVEITLQDHTSDMEEVVVVGYGKQKKEGVVAAVSQTTGKVLERAGGVSSIGAALTGNVPGLVTSASTGLPGQEDPQIIIRGRSTWNNTDPLILVDGVERPMNTVDIGSVETISVLKDASATAVFGSRGANGVILISTKRGQAGKASIRGTVNTTFKVPSKLPGKYDSYDALKIKNDAIEYELASHPEAWNDYLPQAIIDKYRNPASVAEAERYPNVDWVKAMFKDYAISNNANINISGGTKFVKYFTSVDFLHEGDLFKKYTNKRGYDPGFGFNRLNVRNNLDFQLTSSTLFKVNLSGSYGVQKIPWGWTAGGYGPWIDAYAAAPDLFMPVYADGSWGYYDPNPARGENSVRNLALSGVEQQTTAQLTTDFNLEQNLGMLVKGLKFNGAISLDNTFRETGRGINDLYNDAQRKWIDPNTGLAIYKMAYDGLTNFDFQEGVKWSTAGGSVSSNYRRLFYQLQLNYARTLGLKHNITAMGLMNRNVNATNSVLPSYREDWVFRATYNYDNRYTVEYNGAYNGSDQFAPENRFAFFQSGGVNWVVSNEKFMKSLHFLNLFKLRASFGQTGSDNVGGQRFLYLTQWSYGGQSRMGTTGEAAELSPYTWYKESSVGNPNVQWEEAQKINVGADFELFKGMIAGKADIFQDRRSKILVAGSDRAIPSYYGTNAPVANLGKVNTQGYEFELHFKHSFNSKTRFWADLNMTHTQSKIIDKDEPQLLPDYRKQVGKEIGQSYSYVSQGLYNTWDQLYGSTINNTNDNQKLPGNYYLVDYNGDGVIDANDNIPFGFSSWPQNTYNATLGFDWKGFSAFVQFYAANNVTRQVVFSSMTSQSHTVYDEGTYWTKNNNGDLPMLRWLSTPAGYYRGNQYMFDGSYVRLKNAEVAYTFNQGFVRRMGMTGLRLYLNGNNLLTWSKMPDDRESNFAGTGWASQGAYPTVKRYNIGLNLYF